MRVLVLACLVLLGAPAQAQRSPFDTGPSGASGGKVPYAGPQTGAKPPPLGGSGEGRGGSGGGSGSGPSYGFNDGPRVPSRGGEDRGPIPTGRPSASGTAFIVAPGRIMTNNHVVAECDRTVARNARGTRVAARVLATDRRRDLAVLAVPEDLGPSLSFRASPAVRRGEGVVTYGFPLYGLLSSGPTLTTGDISALSGLRDNPANFQISAAVNPGNSGGPLLDGQGNVIGVVVSKLNAARVAQMTDGDIPQNVNFAVKGTEALAFLQAQGVNPQTAASIGTSKPPADIGDIANASTVFLECFR